MTSVSLTGLYAWLTEHHYCTYKEVSYSFKFQQPLKLSAVPILNQVDTRKIQE